MPGHCYVVAKMSLVVAKALVAMCSGIALS